MFSLRLNRMEQFTDAIVSTWEQFQTQTLKLPLFKRLHQVAPQHQLLSSLNTQLLARKILLKRAQEPQWRLLKRRRQEYLDRSVKENPQDRTTSYITNTNTVSFTNILTHQDLKRILKIYSKWTLSSDPANEHFSRIQNSNCVWMIL